MKHSTIMIVKMFGLHSKNCTETQIDIDFITLSDKVQEMSGKQLAYFMTGLTDFAPSTANVENYAKIVWQKSTYKEKLQSQQLNL